MAAFKIACIVSCTYHVQHGFPGKFVIKSFACKDTEKIWSGFQVRRYPADIQERALRKLRLINAAKVMEDLKVPPGNRLEALKGDRTGQLSIRINDQWRICFTWTDNDAFDVEIVDYH